MRPAFAGETQTGRAGPPLLFDLAPRGVFRAPNVAIRAVGSYPTFSPLPNAPDRRRRAQGFALGLPPRSKHHRRFIFCGTFRSRASNPRSRARSMRNPLALPGALPFAAIFLRPLRALLRWSPDFPPAPAVLSVGQIHRKMERASGRKVRTPIAATSQEPRR